MCTIAFGKCLLCPITTDSYQLWSLTIYKPMPNYIYQMPLHQNNLRFAPTVHLYISCDSHNTERLFPSSASADWFL